MRSDQTEIRFGIVAVQKGFVTAAQVVDALVMQAKENFSSGTHRRIGQILLEQGLIDSAQLDEILQTLAEIKHERG